MNVAADMGASVCGALTCPTVGGGGGDLRCPWRRRTSLMTLGQSRQSHDDDDDGDDEKEIGQRRCARGVW